MLVTWLRKGRMICLASLLDLSCECASERRALRERLPSTLKYLAESSQSGLAQMKRLRRVGNNHSGPSEMSL